MFFTFLVAIMQHVFRPTFWMMALALAIWSGLMLAKLIVVHTFGVISMWEWPAAFGLAFVVVWVVNVCRIWFSRWG